MKKTLPFLALAAACFLAACNGKASFTTGAADSTTIKNKATALSAIQGFVTKDADAVMKNCAAGFIDYGTDEGKPMKNIDSIKTGIKDFFTAFPDYKGENIKAVASGDTVIVTGTWGGTFKKDYMGMKATNKSYKADDADIFIFDKDGKITSHRSIQGMATFMAQIMPPAKK